MKTINVKSEIIESIQADFLNENYIREQSYTIKRINKSSGRYYIRINDDDSMIYGPGVTSILFSQMPLSPYLQEWQRNISAQYGADRYKWFMKQSAGYGTYLHVLYGRLLRGESFLLDNNSLFANMQLFFLENEYDFFEIKKWYEAEKRNIEKDILCFIKFCQDYKVKPIAIEYPFVFQGSETANGFLNYSGTIDLVAEITKVDNRKKEKEYKEIALIDFKSGLNGFYESHEIQLYPYMKAWNQEHLDVQIKKTYNFSPSNFRMKSGIKYHFKDQTDSKSLWKWDYYLEMFHKEYSDNPLETQYIIQPEIEANIDIDLDSVIIEYDIKEELLK